MNKVDFIRPVEFMVCGHSLLAHKPWKAKQLARWVSRSYILALCCVLLLLSSCSNLLSSASSESSRQVSSPAARPSLTPTRSSKTDIAAESSLKVELAKVQQIMAGMTLDQKLGQLIIVEYLGNDYSASGLQYMIAQQYVGGFLYQESNHNFDPPYDQISNVAAFSQQAMKDARIPLLIGTDQEGGLVNRLYVFHGYLPSAAEMAATGNPNYAYQQGAQAAKWMLQLGINTDLAPVVDVHTVDPPVLETRMFGSDPQTVVKYAGAYLDGLQQNEVAGCLKHFPGLGAITSDPHTGLPTVNRSLADLEKIDLAPYKLLIASKQPAMIMSTDVLMPAIDPHLPAELSPRTITGILRNQLGYNGVVITDGLYMQGISEQWTLSQAAVLSIIAGDDLVEGPYTPDQVAAVVSALKQAIQQGKLTIDRINQSVQRILLMKLQYGIIK
ncbi:MAG TPA: glycoside hydrolase family 3 N-terminal domain-containing protein [Ktedonobacteraceae bacterium]|nr:glycoside hydrolase family 3 N-terminal domain-containing protein [Ktedonobacteraceae bacterium]